jgi:hypothetical protein
MLLLLLLLLLPLLPLLLPAPTRLPCCCSPHPTLHDRGRGGASLDRLRSRRALSSPAAAVPLLLASKKPPATRSELRRLRCSNSCQILPLPISRYRFKFQSNLVWDSIK